MALGAICLDEWRRSPEIRWEICMGLLVGLATLSLETGSILGLAFAVGIYVWRPNTRMGAFKSVCRVALIGLLLMFILWPAGLLKLSFAKTIGVYLYRIKLGFFSVVSDRLERTVVSLLPALIMCLIGGLGLAFTSEMRLKNGLPIYW